MQGIALYWPIAAALLLVLVVAVAVGRPLLISYRKRRAARAVETVPAPARAIGSRISFAVPARSENRAACDGWNATGKTACTFGRDVQTGMLTAFVGVNIRFESLEGGDMEGVEAVGMVATRRPCSTITAVAGGRRTGPLQHEPLRRPRPLQRADRADRNGLSRVRSSRAKKVCRTNCVIDL